MYKRQLLSEEKLNEVVASTMVGGATLTKLLGTSAWYAPGAAGAYVVAVSYTHLDVYKRQWRLCAVFHTQCWALLGWI